MTSVGGAIIRSAMRRIAVGLSGVVLLAVIVGAAASTEASAAYVVTELRPTASVWSPCLGPSGAQQVFVVVRDQNVNPVAKAAVLLIAHFPDGDRAVVMPQTDENGISQLSLLYEGQPPGQVVTLEFLVIYGELQAQTRDSFRIWW